MARVETIERVKSNNLVLYRMEDGSYNAYGFTLNDLIEFVKSELLDEKDRY